MRALLVAWVALVMGATGWAQGSDAPAVKESWQFNVAVMGYLIPNEQSYAQPTFMADHNNKLHLEARYNNEALYTGSLWIGRDFSFGKKVQFAVTPMIGGVFGDLNGIAPGYEASITYKKIEFSTVGEYVFDTSSKSGNFFYNWSQLGYNITNWLQAGGVLQRTKAYQTSLDVQRGFFAGVSHKNLNYTTYVFNAGWTDPTVVLSMSWSFSAK